MREDVKEELFAKAVRQPAYFKRLYDDLSALRSHLEPQLYNDEGFLDFEVVQALGATYELLFFLSYKTALDAAAATKAAALKIDPSTGAELRPGEPDRCEGNGKHPDFEICCDNCNWYLECFPEDDPKAQKTGL